MTVKERLVEYLHYKRLSQGAFEKAAKLSNGYVNNIRKSISSDKLQSMSLFDPDLNTGWLITGEGEMLKSNDKKKQAQVNKPDIYSTPYYPEVNASAGLNFINQADGHYSIPISIPNVKADAFINVFGDSMYPKYCSGEIIGRKEIEKDMVMFGHAYVIQMSDGEAYLKYIKKGTTDDKWLLVSENEHYEPREFHLKYIDKVFIIKATISRTSLL